MTGLGFFLLLAGITVALFIDDHTRLSDRAAIAFMAPIVIGWGLLIVGLTVKLWELMP